MQPFDCTTLQPFSVIRLPYEFDGDPDRQTKLFVVALNVTEVGLLRCFKPTTQVEFYDKEPDRLKGVVEFRKGETCFDAERTIIDPKAYVVHHTAIQHFHFRSQFEIIGQLPNDFRERMKAAVRAKAEWRKAQKEEFFKWFQ